MHARTLGLLIALALLPVTVTAKDRDPGVTAGGAFTCDFGVALDTPPAEIASTIERDRMYMAERPGMLFKHIPIVPDPAGQQLLSGGRYLFDTAAHAADYLRWVRDDFDPGGVPFLERAYFRAPDCHAWSVVGTATWGDIHTDQVALRTERWSVPAHGAPPILRHEWPTIRDEARARGLSAVWLLHEPQEDLATIVSFAPPLSPAPPAASFALLAASGTLGSAFDARGWERTLDRTQWSFDIWFPYEFADSGEPSIWRNSPPFPEPSTSDGVCVPSRGETFATAPDDCTPRCGDGIRDADETWERCPSDVRTYVPAP